MPTVTTQVVTTITTTLTYPEDDATDVGIEHDCKVDVESEVGAGLVKAVLIGQARSMLAELGQGEEEQR